MRALVFDDSLHFQSAYPVPEPTMDEYLIRVTKAGVCNTDLELIKGYMGFQGVLGHEFVGVVEGGDRDGQRVVGEINLADGTCDMCRQGVPSQCRNRTTLGIDRKDGALAEFITLPRVNTHPVPASVSDDQAVFVEPLAAGLQVLEQTHIRPTDRVVLIGAGKLGLLTAQVIALTGCDLTVITRHTRQQELLQRWGIAAVGSGELPPNQADIVVDCTGSASGFADALNLVRPRGTLHLKSTYAALPQADLTRVVVDEIRIESSRCGPFPAALGLLAKGLVDVESLIEARYPLNEAVKAFEHAARKGALKVIIEL